MLKILQMPPKGAKKRHETVSFGTCRCDASIRRELIDKLLYICHTRLHKAGLRDTVTERFGPNEKTRLYPYIKSRNA